MPTTKKSRNLNSIPNPGNSRQQFSDVEILKRRRLDELMNYWNTLRNKDVIEMLADPSSDEFFGAIVQLAVRDYGVQQNQLAKYLGISPSTVGRWADGAALPPLYAREKVAAAIADLVELEIRARQESFLLA